MDCPNCKKEAAQVGNKINCEVCGWFEQQQDGGFAVCEPPAEPEPVEPEAQPEPEPEPVEPEAQPEPEPEQENDEGTHFRIHFEDE